MTINCPLDVVEPP